MEVFISAIIAVILGELYRERIHGTCRDITVENIISLFTTRKGAAPQKPVRSLKTKPAAAPKTAKEHRSAVPIILKKAA